MAITSITGIAGNTGSGVTVPAYNPMVIAAVSNATAQDNFEYIFDISITGQTFAGGATFIRLKAPADPTYGSGFCNLSPIVQRYLTSDIGNDIYGFQQASNSIKEVVVQFGELYGVGSGVTAYTNQNSYTFYAFNGSIPALAWRNAYTSADYAANTFATPVNLLTNSPSSGSIRTSEDAWIDIISQTSGAVKYAEIKISSNGGSDRYITVVNPNYHNTSTVANRMLRFPSGFNLNSIAAGSIMYGESQPILSALAGATATEYEIFFKDSSFRRISDSFYYKISDLCTPHTIYRLHFKNKFGAFDSFSFIRASQVSTDINRKSYEKTIGEPKSATSYTYNNTDRFQSNYHTQHKHTIKLNSDWINEDQSVWLEELLTSPEIYHDDDTHGLVPVNIVETNYVQRQAKTDKIFNLSVSIQYSFSETRQGG